MKQFITPQMVFTPGAANTGTLQFINVPGTIDIRKLAAVINLTRGVVIFKASQALSAWNAATQTLTLLVNTTGHNAADVLDVIYEEEANVIPTTNYKGDPVYNQVVALQDAKTVTVIAPNNNTHRLMLTYAVPLAAGAGHKIGDIITCAGGTFTTAAKVRVTSVDGSGGILGVSVDTIGAYTTAQTSLTQGSTTGTGTGATFTTTMVSDICAQIDTTGYNAVQFSFGPASVAQFVVANVDGSMDGGKTWYRVSWYFDNYQPVTFNTGSAFTGNTNLIPNPPPLIRIIGARNSNQTTADISYSLRLSANQPPVAIQGANTGTNQYWWVKLLASVFGANGGTGNYGGVSLKIVSAASTNSTLVWNGGGSRVIALLELCNTHATNWAFFKIYNKSSAPTVGTDVPVHTIGIPPNGRVNITADAVGMTSSTPNGFGYAITGGYADTDTTAVLAGQVLGTLLLN